MYEIESKFNLFLLENLPLSFGWRGDWAVVLLEKEQDSDADPAFQHGIFWIDIQRLNI